MMNFLSRLKPQFSWVFCLSIVQVSSLAFAYDDGNPSKDQSRTAERKLAVQTLTNYCYDCHSQEGAEGGIEVDFLEVGEQLDEERIDTVEKIIRVLKEQEMPPADSDQPDATERVATLEWIQKRLDNFDCGSVSGPGRVTMRRLNRIEYDNTIRDLTGLNLSLAQDFPSDDVGNGFDNIGDVLTIPPILMEKYIDAAMTVAFEVTQNPTALGKVFPHEPENKEDVEQIVAAARANAEHFASLAFRRPAKPDEVDRLFEVMKSAFERGASEEQIKASVIATALSSPHFIYKVESDRPSDYTAGVRLLNGYEIATRLSYFLWSTMPDKELFRAARKGELDTEEGILDQVERMLDAPKSKALVENFAGQWFQLRDLIQLSPDPELFSDFDDGLRNAMRRETELLFLDLIRNDRSILSLLNADYTFVNERLAKHYGLEFAGDANVEHQDWLGEYRKVSLEGRRGVLMHASILLITSNPTRTSPVKRGKWVLDNLLGEPPPPPPPDVAELEEGGENLGTLRQQMEQHRANPNCAVCHTKMDALGFGLENFDVIGKWRENDGRYTINPSGELPGGRKFDGPVDLVKILAEDKKREFTRCFTEKLLTYALGRGLKVSDRCAVNMVTERVQAEDLRFRALVRAIVTSEPFRYQQQSK